MARNRILIHSLEVDRFLKSSEVTDELKKQAEFFTSRSSRLSVEVKRGRSRVFVNVKDKNRDAIAHEIQTQELSRLISQRKNQGTL